MVTHISFDLDGTLAYEEIDVIIWNELIPELYAETHEVSHEEGMKQVFSEYYRALHIEKIPTWTDIEYWFDRLELTGWEDMLARVKQHIKLYNDTLETLEYLSKKYTLVLVTSNDRKFLDMKLEGADLKRLFKHTFTAPETKQSKKNKITFQAALETLNIDPDQIVHIGNELDSDVEEPNKVGIKAYRIDRTGSGDIKSLLDLKKVL